MATVDELIEQSKLKEEAVAPATTTAAEPSEGLLSRIHGFIAGSNKADTLDATGLTQADRRQSLFAGLTDIGAKLMAAGEPMWGHQRAQILASMGNVPANMSQMRSSIAQQKLLGLKGMQAQRELQVQREMDAIAKDPNHAIWKQFQGQDLALAQWAMRSGGPKAFMEFLAHKDDAVYKRAMAAKAMAEVDLKRREAAGVEGFWSGGGGGQPAPGGAPPVAAPPTAVPPAQPSPAGVSTSGSLPPFVVPGMPQAALNTDQQTLVAEAPPTAGVGGAEAVQPTASAQAILEGMGGAGGGGGAQVAEAPTSTPVVPTPPPASIMRLPKPGAVPPPAVPPPAVPPPAVPPPAVPPPAVPTQGTQGITLPPGYALPRTRDELLATMPPVEQARIRAMPYSEQMKEIGKWTTGETKKVVHIPTGRIIEVNKHAPSHPDFGTPEDAAHQVKLRQLAIEAINKTMVIDPVTGKPTPNRELAEQLYKQEAAKAQAQAEANQVGRQRDIQQQQADASSMQAGTAAKQQAVTATKEGQTPEGKIDPQLQEQILQQKVEEARLKGDVELRNKLAQKDYENYGDPEKGSLAKVQGANKMLPLIYQAEEYRKQGMLTGSFPETRMMLNRMRSTMGLTGDVSQDQINRTGYNNVVGRMMIEGLQSGRPLGSQVSDADREAMKELTGLGSYGDKEIAELMDIAERTAKSAFANHQKTVSDLSRKHPSLKDILAVDADIKPVDRETWTQQYRSDQEERKRKESQGGAGGFGRR